MRIIDLKGLFEINTKFYLQNPNDNTDNFEIKNILFGTRAFADIGLVITSIRAIAKNKIVIRIFDMPTEVYQAWKKCNEYYQALEKYQEGLIK